MRLDLEQNYSPNIWLVLEAAVKMEEEPRHAGKTLLLYGYRSLEKNKTWWPWPALAKFLSSLSPLFTALWFPPIDKRAKQTVPALPSQPRPDFTIGQDNRGQFFSRDVFFSAGMKFMSPLHICVSAHRVTNENLTGKHFYAMCDISFFYWAHISWAGAVFGRAGRQPRGEQHGLPGLLQHWTPDRDNRRLWKMALVWGAVRSTWQLLHNSVAPRARRSHMESNIYSEPCTIKHLWAFKRR